MLRVDLREPTGPCPARTGHAFDELVEEECWIAERAGAARAGSRFSLDEQRSA